MSFLYQIKDGSRKITQYHFSRYLRNVELCCYGTPLFKRWFVLLKEWRKRGFVKYYDAFVVLTNEDAKAWGNHSNLYVIPNAMSFMPKKSSTCSNKQVISVGRLNMMKGYDLLLDVWHNVIDKHPDWQLVIYGHGEDYSRLQSIVQRYGIADSVSIYPPTRDILDKYLESSIYVMTSYSEGFPMVLLEAMACGLPCVSFATSCGPTEIISNEEDGFVTPLGNVQALSEKLSLLMSDEDLRARMGKKARLNIMRYSVDRVMKQWEDLLGS